MKGRKAAASVHGYENYRVRTLGGTAGMEPSTALCSHGKPMGSRRGKDCRAASYQHCKPAVLSSARGTMERFSLFHEISEPVLSSSLSLGLLQFWERKRGRQVGVRVKKNGLISLFSASIFSHFLLQKGLRD